jgi:cytosine/adenosine deaminase-related metal-dependent hydrolase
MPSTCIRNAAWVAAWDAAAGRHVYRRGIDVAWQDDRLVHVGPGYAGPADTEVDGRALFVLPGLVNVHSHPDHEPAYKGVREEHGLAAHSMSGLYERSQAFKLDLAGRQASAEVAYAELLACGVTSLCDITFEYEGWLELLARSGLRGFAAPSYADARWFLDKERPWQLGYRWDERAGRRGFELALACIERAEAHPCGRLSGVLSPMQIDTCREALLRDSVAVARQHGRPLTVHCAQSAVEFHEMVQRHGTTPVQWAHGLGLLGPGTVLGHCIFVDEHRWLHWHTRRDVDLLAGTGASVAHCPTVFSRYGQTLQHFGRYRRAGVNLGLGTDCSPHNLIEEMRAAAILGRVAAEDIEALSTADVFHAATVGGATALLRDDLGRLAPGAKADVVCADLADVTMQPARDPLRSLIYTAAERAVRDVYVDGAQVVRERRVLTLDRAAAVQRLAEAQQRMLADVPRHDYAGRRAEEIAPLSLPLA